MLEEKTHLSQLGSCAPDGDFFASVVSGVPRGGRLECSAAMDLLKGESRYDAMMAKGDNCAIGSVQKPENSEGR